MTMNDSQLQIERLVDGELPFEEEAKLLEAFEEQPAGWKQLALAFLEDRTFRASLAANDACSSRSVPVSTSAMMTTLKSPDKVTRSWNTNTVRIFAACAVLLAAFFFGRYSANASRVATPEPIVTDSNPSPDSQQRENNIPDASNELPPPIEFISLNVGNAGEDVETVDVPLLSWDQVAASAEAEQMNELPSLIPAELRELLARRGQTVREYIDYYEFELPDGRVGVIPVSSVEIQARAIPTIQ